MNRRGFLIAGLASVAAALILARARLAQLIGMAPRHEVLTQEERAGLLDCLAHFLGKDELMGSLPFGCGEPCAVRTVDLDQLTRQLLERDPAARLSHLTDMVKTDFEKAAVVSADGWIFSRTELTALVLRAFLIT